MADVIFGTNDFKSKVEFVRQRWRNALLNDEHGCGDLIRAAVGPRDHVRATALCKLEFTVTSTAAIGNPRGEKLGQKQEPAKIDSTSGLKSVR